LQDIAKTLKQIEADVGWLRQHIEEHLHQSGIDELPLFLCPAAPVKLTASPTTELPWFLEPENLPLKNTG